ncbi:MAG: hypothetical protein AAF363_14895 [Bacteroidota bacterium]
MQIFLVVVLFALAAFYLGKILYKEFSGKGSHCGDCDVPHILNNNTKE